MPCWFRHGLTVSEATPSRLKPRLHETDVGVLGTLHFIFRQSVFVRSIGWKFSLCFGVMSMRVNIQMKSEYVLCWCFGCIVLACRGVRLSLEKSLLRQCCYGNVPYWPSAYYRGCLRTNIAVG